MKKVIALLLMLCLALSIVACGGNGKTDESKAPADKTEAPADDKETEAPADDKETEAPADDKETEAPADDKETEPEASEGGSSIAVCLASEPDTIDPALNSALDGGIYLVHLFQGLSKWDLDENGNPVIVPDAAEELVEPVMNEDGTVTYTYTLRDGLKWSDGQPLTANDFVFAWNRAASFELAADYGYLLDLIVGYDKIWELTGEGEDAVQVNPDAKLAVEALDEKTLQVTTTNAATYWDELLAFPTFFPVREDVVADETWATKPETYISNGAYKMTDWDHSSVITVEKNPNFIDADQIKMDKIEFFLSDDANNQLTNFQNGAWQLIDDVPTNEIAALQESNPDEFFVTGQIGTYYACFNLNESLLPADSTLTGAEAEAANAEIRRGLGMLLDRNYIVNEIAQGGQVPASSFVAMGITEPDGSEFYKNTGVSSDYDGYYNVTPEAFESTWAEGMELLKKYYDFDEATGQFTNAPSIPYLYNTNEAHQAIGEYIQQAFSSVGIDMTLENQEWNTFLNTRKAGDYVMARNGWVADYNDPISFLDMWTSISGNNDIQFGKGAHKDLAIYSIDFSDLGSDLKVENGTWAETYDAAINVIKNEKDPAVRYQMMHRAEDLLMSTNGIVPIYYYTDLYMLKNNVEGFFITPLGFKYFNYCVIK